MSTHSISKVKEEWDLIIRPQRPWWDLRLGELWRYRDLIGLWVRREFVALYKQMILGPLWHVIPAIISSVVYTIIFSEIAKISTDGVPPYLFYMAGITMWSFFSGCISTTANTFTLNVSIFGKIYFPRLIMPIASIISQMVGFGVRFGVFLVFWIFFLLSPESRISTSFWMFSLPLLILIVAGLGMGSGIIISALTTKYRDIQQLFGVALPLVMYATPILYPLSTVPDTWRWFFLLNPLTPVIETFRCAFLGTEAPDLIYLAYSIVVMLIVLSIGIVVFNKAESNFMDTI